MKTIMEVNDRKYRIIRLLGKGKGGYSYLCTDEEKEYVLKQIHHEPCSYYQFGDKLAAELNDYERLLRTGISMPALLFADRERERILKEYIKGKTVFELILQDEMQKDYLEQMQAMLKPLYEAGLNIDYYPANFVVQEGRLFYIDYECNAYMDEWNFENWGEKYWSKTPEFLKAAKESKADG